jgi:hypothetical protein
MRAAGNPRRSPVEHARSAAVWLQMIRLPRPHHVALRRGRCPAARPERLSCLRLKSNSSCFGKPPDPASRTTQQEEWVLASGIRRGEKNHACSLHDITDRWDVPSAGAVRTRITGRGSRSCLRNRSILLFYHRGRWLPLLSSRIRLSRRQLRSAARHSIRCRIAGKAGVGESADNGQGQRMTGPRFGLSGSTSVDPVLSRSCASRKRQFGKSLKRWWVRQGLNL